MYIYTLNYGLTHWGRVTHICVSKLTTIGSDNSLSPGRRQAIIWTNDGILLIRTLGTNFSEILSEIRSFSFKKMYLKMSSANWRLFHLGLNELMIKASLMTSGNWDALHITGPFWDELPLTRGLPSSKGQNCDIGCLLTCLPEQAVKQSNEGKSNDSAQGPYAGNVSKEFQNCMHCNPKLVISVQVVKINHELP